MLKKELRYFFTALMFLTRLPVPQTTDHKPEYLEKSSRYFPLVGWVVGFIAAVAFVAASYLTIPLAAIFCIIASVLATGAFHEDGFADMCDAFGGGWTKEKILTIMKDSRLGTFGTVGLILILSLKCYLLIIIALQPGLAHTILPAPWPVVLFPALIIFAAHSISRLMPLVMIQTYQYVFQDDLSKSKPLASTRLGWGPMLFAIITALLPFVILPWQYICSLLPMLLAVWWLGRFFKKWIGGYTGDCLGSVQQVTEIIFLLGVFIINKYWLKIPV
jgi:adenosylcobinamide-GDP ribazoletransferase